MKKRRIRLILMAVVLAGCSPRTSTLAPTEKIEVASPTRRISTSTAHQTPTATIPPPFLADSDLRLHITTTSDWTTVRLAGEVSVEEHAILSASSAASTANFDQDRVFLSQPIDRAEAGQSVEMEVDVRMTSGFENEDMIIEIDRGHLGGTTVELSRVVCGERRSIEPMVWNDIRDSGENVQSFTVPAGAFSTTGENEYIVIAQLNFWFYGPGPYGGFENKVGGRNTPLIPLLGETYNAANPAVVQQQIEWAVEYGVDAFSIEWTTPRGVGCCGSMEDTLDDVFLRSSNIEKVRWVIFYDFVLRLDQTEGLKQYVGSFDFNEPDVYDTLVADFKHFARKYFGHPQYLTMDGRPVIYIWATNAYQGDLEGALRQARQEVADLGYDVFIVGEEVLAHRFDPTHASLFDGNTNFTFLIGGLDIFSWEDVGEAVPEVDRTFEFWRSNLEGLKVIDRDENVNFQPAWAPQYDDRSFIVDGGIYVPATSKEQVKQMALVAKKHTVPFGDQGLRLVWLNTWNNWPETTTVEPTVNLGPKYPAGNYQFDMLEVVREVFGPETFACPSP